MPSSLDALGTAALLTCHCCHSLIIQGLSLPLSTWRSSGMPLTGTSPASAVSSDICPSSSLRKLKLITATGTWPLLPSLVYRIIEVDLNNVIVPTRLYFLAETNHKISSMSMSMSMSSIASMGTRMTQGMDNKPVGKSKDQLNIDTRLTFEDVAGQVRSNVPCISIEFRRLLCMGGTCCDDML